MRCAKPAGTSRPTPAARTRRSASSWRPRSRRTASRRWSPHPPWAWASTSRTWASSSTWARRRRPSRTTSRWAVRGVRPAPRTSCSCRAVRTRTSGSTSRRPRCRRRTTRGRSSTRWPTRGHCPCPPWRPAWACAAAGSNCCSRLSASTARSSASAAGTPPRVPDGSTTASGTGRWQRCGGRKRSRCSTTSRPRCAACASSPKRWTTRTRRTAGGATTAMRSGGPMT